MQFKTTTSPHSEDTHSVQKVMLQVLLALVPGAILAITFFSWGVLSNIILAIIFALMFEAISLQVRGRPIKPFLSDLSAIVTALLLALAMPALSPWWLILIGMFFAIVVTKHLYGGLGYNPFNPAMVGYVVLLISFPTLMTRWVSPTELTQYSLSISEVLQVVFSGTLPPSVAWDAITQATPLDTAKTQLGLNLTVSEIKSMDVFGFFGGIGWEAVGAAYALGGFWLIYKKLIDWRVPVAVIAGLAIPSLFFSLVDSDYYLSPLFHIFSGGVLLGAFFIATDPVSGCSSTRGRIYFALGVGFLTFVIRTWGSYPDSIAFAILLMNMAAPMIDYYTVPRVFGNKEEQE